MATVTTIVEESVIPVVPAPSPGAVSWPAILAGAVAAAALSLILLVLGMGLGLSAVSPWTGFGPSETALAWTTIAWICFTAFAASALGGYIAGRLRVRWASTHGDEVYFRDTAHGFLAWAVATLITAATLTSVIGAIVGTVGKAAVAAGTGAAVAATAAPAPTERDPAAYLVDSLFRRAAGNTTPPLPSPAPEQIRTREEIGRIFDNSMHVGPLPAVDAAYIAQVVAEETGLTQQEAERRVVDTFNSAQLRAREAEEKTRQLADEARRNGAYASLWIFVSLLLGAFTASLMATFGGRQRDLI